MKELKELNGFVSQADIELLLADSNCNDHPLLYYLFADVTDSTGYYGYTKANTFFAIRRLQCLDAQWLAQQKKKVLEKDRNNASAALGEIRCYENLIEVFGKDKVSIVHTEKNKQTSDIAVEYYSEKVIVEINTVQMNGKEAEELKAFHSLKPSGKGIQMREHVSHPFGTSIGCTVTEKVIYKIINIKQQSSQFSEDEPSVLWIDLQDEKINLICDRLYNISPVFTGKNIGGEAFFSNELWYALYATKDMPVFEGVSLDCNEGIELKELPSMKLDGKFALANSTKIDAVVFSGPNAVILCENPFSTKPLPAWFIEKLTSMKWFKFESSRTNLPCNQLTKQLEIDRTIIEELGKKKFYRW